MTRRIPLSFAERNFVLVPGRRGYQIAEQVAVEIWQERVRIRRWVWEDKRFAPATVVPLTMIVGKPAPDDVRFRDIQFAVAQEIADATTPVRVPEDELAAAKRVAKKRRQTSE